MGQLIRKVGVLCLLAPLLGGCASAQHPRPPAGSTTRSVRLTCPIVVASPGTPSGVLASDPVAAIACIANEPPAKRLPGNDIPITTARRFVRLLARAAPASANQAKRCAFSPADVAAVIRLGYPDGHAVDVLEAAPDCGGILFAAGRAFALPAEVGELVFAATAPHATLRLPPDAALRHWPACRSSALVLTFMPGGAGAGNDVGTIDIGNRGSSWCELRGPITVTGLDAGTPVTVVARAGVRPYVELAPGDRYRMGETSLIAEYRDDPSAPDGLCQPHWVTPRSWRIELAGAAFTVPNGQGRADRQGIGTHGLVTCRGRFGVSEIGIRP